jgi:endo-1,4-beta-xylanase
MFRHPVIIAAALLGSFSFIGALAADGALDEAIRRTRTGTIVLEGGQPGAEARVEQVRHEFWFGAALANHMFGNRSSSDVAQYRKVFLENFNAAVTENALKWHVMEREQGRVDYSVVDAILAWTEEHSIPLRGHNIFWGVPDWTPAWQKTLSNEELRRVVEARARDIARRYRGRFVEYDLNNEMLHGNLYEERLGPGITKDMARWIHEEDPDAKLALNDYDILTGRRLEDFMNHAQRFLREGVPFATVGVQGHVHGDSFDPEVLKRSLDRLAELGLPICVTEFNFPGQRSRHYGKRGATLTEEEEQAKAKALTEYFRICFAHPAVKGILLWGFWEGANWIPVSSLYRRDWTPTPAAQAYRDLVFKEWWTAWSGRLDDNGRREIPAFYGTHRVTVGDRTLTVTLSKAEGRARVDLREAR